MMQLFKVECIRSNSETLTYRVQLFLFYSILYEHYNRPRSRIMRLLVGWLSKLAPLAAGYIAGEIWLKSAGLTSRLKLASYDFLQVPGATDRCGTKMPKIDE